ncbi:sodium-coupled monocarboxylate transporter 2-like [Uloborus diversus]|uniref:sodium-coupled monocarboxylate transporter 2-like n=1 Tax=Uloborus diversus TaxID=327109 RepID=UPI00240A77DE|nr:sodium-coupled monocarboxylate transporter 2-like [Uloborus diversus]XP_054710072.1 sodium-coupled monocarboxylate transporter 2-like [Uloborus diversus]XP_054710073.1 sodium-coupled monocarboxylate transporter 2-like [Uloborus diversus]
MAQVFKDVFSTIDYVVFALMLAISAGIGVWYAFADRKKSNTQEFLMGGRSLSVLPVAMSVLASFMSAITLLGTPAEIYNYGTQYIMINIAFCFVVPSTAYLYLPVFYNLQVTSAYEYLELRFHKYVRTIGSAVFFMHMLMYMPVVLYAPALALSEVTGIKIWTAVLSIGLVCTFYTSIGGIKAVVWTDFFQSVMMYASVLIIVIKGAIDIGGFDLVFERSFEGDRIEFLRFDINPTVRHTFWSLVFGGYITWMGNYAANQAMIQRYLTIGTLRGAQNCLWINLPALVILILITSMSGLVIYAFYAACDPIGTKVIDAPDQLFPRFVMETLGSLPGIPGLFVSGIFSGALSTVSSGVNSLAAVTLEDFIKTYFVKNLSELWATRITKMLATVYGLLSIALVIVAQQLGGVLQAALTIHGVVGGPMLGVFTLGMFFPCANTWGASTGLLSGFVIAMWFGMGAFSSKPYQPLLPRSYTNCTELYYNVTKIDLKNMTTIPEIIPNNDHIFPPYRLSYLWLSAIGFVIVLIVGVTISLITGPRKCDDVDEKLLSPAVIWLRKFLPGGRCKTLRIQRKRRGTSLNTLRTSVISSDDEIYYASKKGSISYISDSKIS